MSKNNQSRAQFFKNNPKARAWAALDTATNQQKKITPGAIKIKPNQFAGKRAIILGSGVAGLTTAYELLTQESGMQVTVLEARNRTGGRCLTLRTGDTLTEDINNELFDSSPGETQVVRFKRPLGDSEPYLNAGPGRIPSSHKRVLHYLKKFAVDIEVYVMNSESNLVQMANGPINSEPVAYRRLDHNTRGWLAQIVYENAESLTQSTWPNEESSWKMRTEQIQNLMISFGELAPSGENIGQYAPTAGEDGLENGISRAGYKVLPGVDAGEIAEALSFESLLESEFWDKTRFYQPVDFPWQPTSFQPVGGMDQVQHAFAQQVTALGGTIHLNSPVSSIDWDSDANEFIIQVKQIGTSKCIEYRADYCFSNIAMPFLKNILSNNLQSTNTDCGLNDNFKNSLQAVYGSQFEPKEEPDQNGYVARFLANTTKVGWQADRNLWQGSPITPYHDKSCNQEILAVPKSEAGVVPIFGGISWTDHEIVQIWYPSTAYNDEKGVLTGAYNFSETAFKWGKLDVNSRLENAQEGAGLFGQAFADGLKDGVAIAWQNMPYIKGGWAQWHVVENSVEHFNCLAQGSAVSDVEGNLSNLNFFIIGDQLSSLPGWQEGAIASALNSISRLTRPDLEIPYLSSLPDTRLMVEGI
ncbi:flavin monoamine oxidase family protein [Candidatus Marithrix sp. Canyon 246]|uniref:flavin monoamine oxidase family protein n=1 Tax=Candidatus Marithrix sp. Canyon 246 TaxID=1827136 RepID=UPI00084A1D25|nr:FAD-dependent oxidoreductase [Candidatus Marithrix sp. Canyon 246]